MRICLIQIVSFWKIVCSKEGRLGTLLINSAPCCSAVTCPIWKHGRRNLQFVEMIKDLVRVQRGCIPSKFQQFGAIYVSEKTFPN